MTTSFFSGQNMAPEADSTNELIDTLTAQVATVTAANAQAQAASTAAAASASNAAISEANVSTLAQQANTTLATAQTAITTAQAATTTATTAASTATSQASTATTQANIATTQAGLAATSEANALASAGTASTQAGIATTQAGNSATSAAASLASKNAAGTSETNAAASATAAATSRTNAATSETSAASSATAANTSKVNAGTSETNAANSATAAATSATQAAASATLATNQTAYLAGRNRIINGDCRVQQKAAVAAVAGTFQYGGVDRFANVCGSTQTPGVTQQVQVDVDENGTSKYWVRHQVTTAVADFSSTKYWGGITQPIEGQNVFDLKGNPKGVTVSFRFKAKVPGTYGVTLFDNAVTYSVTKVITVTAADTPQYFAVSFPTVPTGVSFGANATTFLAVRIGGLNTGTSMCPTANLGTWQTTGYYTAQGQVNWGASTANYIQVTDLQFEEGQVATPFERRQYGQEFALCQRYYQSLNTGWDIPTYAAASLGQWHALPVAMRAAPTTTLGTPSENVNVSGTPAISPLSATGYRILASSAAAGVSYYTNTIALSAEL
jgi:hypothetical protein